MKQIILFPKGELAAGDKAALLKADYIPLEVTDPSQVVMLFPNSERLTGDAVTVSALNAITGPNSGHERQRFASSMIAALLRSQPPQA